MKLLEGSPHERDSYIPITDSPGVGKYCLSQSCVLSKGISPSKSECSCESQNLSGEKKIILHSKFNLTRPLILNSKLEV